MQSIEIFKTGTHTASDGRTLTFTAADLAAAAAAYAPGTHEAPLVVGHPRLDDPAYGWVKSLSVKGDSLVAEPCQLDPAFAELVSAGRYKKLSASFYTPDAPGNPKPGTYYLKHVGFLGAQAPAVKGLKPIAFGEGEAGTISFSADAGLYSSLISMFTGLREWMIGQFGQEKADQVVPNWQLDTLRSAAAADATEDAAEGEGTLPTMAPAYAEPAASTAPATPAAPDAAFAEKLASLEAREAAIAAREREQRQAEDAAFVERLVAEGRVLPANRPATVAFMAALDAAGEVEFAEGRKQTPHAAFRALLAALPQAVSFGESAPAGDAPPPEGETPQAILDRALAYQAEQAKEGREISIELAFSQISRAARA